MSLKKFYWFGFLSLIFFLLDRAFKWIVVNSSEGSFFIIPEILEVKLLENPGIAFSLFISYPYLYILIVVILLILNFLLVKSFQDKNYFLSLSFILIIIGGISNLLDRLVYGSIIDYLNLFFLPVFNIADLMIISGVLMILIKGFKKKEKKIKNLDKKILL